MADKISNLATSNDGAMFSSFSPLISQDSPIDDDSLKASSTGTKKKQKVDNIPTNPFHFTGAMSSINTESTSPECHLHSDTGAIPKHNSCGEKLRRFKTTKEELIEARDSYSSLLKMVLEPNKTNFTAFCKEKKDQIREVREQQEQLALLHDEIMNSEETTAEGLEITQETMRNLIHKLDRLSMCIDQLQIANDVSQE